MKFVREDGEFDVDAFRFAAKVTITAQEILVDNASYPTPKIEENSHRFRPLGLGYANLGALLMNRGLAYDSERGPQLRGGDHRADARRGLPPELGSSPATTAAPSSSTTVNREPFLRVIEKHRDAAYAIPEEGVPTEMLEAARRTYDEALAARPRSTATATPR